MPFVGAKRQLHEMAFDRMHQGMLMVMIIGVTSHLLICLNFLSLFHRLSLSLLFTHSSLLSRHTPTTPVMLLLIAEEIWCTQSKQEKSKTTAVIVTDQS